MSVEQPVSVPYQGGGDWPAVTSMAVLYDASCRLCRSAQRWLSSRRQLVPLEFVAAGSPLARQRFPQLNPAATLRDLTVVTDSGLVYSGEAAWLACLWALAGYRSWAERLARPSLLPFARRVIATAAAARERDLARYGGRDALKEDTASEAGNVAGYDDGFEEDGASCEYGCR